MKTTPTGQRRLVIDDTVLFDMFLLVLFLTLFFVSFNYNARASSIPMALGVVGSLMVALQLLVDMVPSLRQTFRFVVESGLLGGQGAKGEAEKTDGAGPVEEILTREEKNRSDLEDWLKVLRLVIWMAAFIVLLGTAHYLIAVGLFVVLITRLEAKESWLRSFLLAVCVDGAFFVLFELILQAQL